VSASMQYAQALARHAKAALLHLRQAERLAELAGVDIDASEHDVPPSGLIRAAGEAAEDLDLWASSNARTSGAVPGETYTHTERWCHAEGGSLPPGSWPHPADPGLEPDRAALRSDLARLRQAREAWDATARACVGLPDRCSRGEFADHAGASGGCMVCADLDPGQPCYAAVLGALCAREGRL
jgi:hypothetical protein